MPPGRPAPVGAAAATLRNLTDADLPEEYPGELERQVTGAGLPPDSRTRTWETLKAIRQARSDRGSLGKEQQAG